MPRVIVAAIYKYLNECMKLLWNESMRLNTVHVDDVCAAMWFLALNPAAAGEIYNIVDDADSTQGTISDILSDVFSINVDYFGVVMSNLTKVRKFSHFPQCFIPLRNRFLLNIYS